MYENQRISLYTNWKFNGNFEDCRKGGGHTFLKEKQINIKFIICQLNKLKTETLTPSPSWMAIKHINYRLIDCECQEVGKIHILFDRSFIRIFLGNLRSSSDINYKLTDFMTVLHRNCFVTMSIIFIYWTDQNVKSTIGIKFQIICIYPYSFQGIFGIPKEGVEQCFLMLAIY